jgi:hypothetical protein
MITDRNRKMIKDDRNLVNKNRKQETKLIFAKTIRKQLQQ